MACLIFLGKGIVLSRSPLTFTRAFQLWWLQTMEEARGFLTQTHLAPPHSPVHSPLGLDFGNLIWGLPSFWRNRRAGEVSRQVVYNAHKSIDSSALAVSTYELSARVIYSPLSDD
jgi:hypothetical protein